MSLLSKEFKESAGINLGGGLHPELAARRAQREHESREYQALRNHSYEQESGEHRILSPEAAHRVVEIAIEQTTQEHQIPVEVRPSEQHIEQNPAQEQPIAPPTQQLH